MRAEQQARFEAEAKVALERQARAEAEEQVMSCLTEINELQKLRGDGEAALLVVQGLLAQLQAPRSRRDHAELIPRSAEISAEMAV